MASSTLLYIAWPLTLGLSFIAGSMIFSNESTTQNSKVSHRNSSSNDFINKNSATTNRRSTTTRSRTGKNIHAKSYAIKEITDTSDPQKRLAMLLSMVDKLGSSDFEHLLVDFRERDRSIISTMEERLLLKAWAKINPESALAYAKENKSLNASRTALRTWAEYAPDAAIQWVKLNYEGDKTSSYLLDIIAGISSSDPERAIGMLPELRGGGDYRYGLDVILPHVSKLGTEKTNAWLATIKNERLRSNTTSKAVRSLAAIDPQATADWLKTLPENIQHNNVGNIAHAWAAQDIDKATEWTSSLIGKNRTLAASQMIGQFVSSDPNKAATWMKTMSDEPGYQSVVRSFMYNAANNYPEIALANLDQLSRESNRNDSRIRSLTNWAAKDKTEATQWMQTNNIDVAVQKEILSKATKFRRW